MTTEILFKIGSILQNLVRNILVGFSGLKQTLIDLPRIFHRRRYMLRPVPGDIIQIDNGIVYLNNEKLLETYLTNSYSGRSIGPIVVENDTFFVLGDNRAESNDSRNGWFVPYDNVIGKAWVLYWPLNKLSSI